MDFFSHQDKARRYTRLLYLYLFLAISLIVLAVNLSFYYFFKFLEFYPYTPQTWFSQGLVYYVSGATLALIIIGSVYRWIKLKSGGHAIAAMMGARRVDLHTRDVQQRQLINVVEEMSIASGVPLPTLYILHEESGINAFVAGYLPTEAVMVVSQGALEQLNRHEMQSVAAHEYSHILNGDMQINIKLVALLAGILMISALGRVLMSGQRRSHHRHHRSGFLHSGSSGSGGKSSGAIALFGLVLFVIGYIGVFCGKLIKAAVSRQREFLADAASVQFTRNPEGIVSALNKIREASQAGVLQNAHAEEMSHMCFAQPLLGRISGWLATHPPLPERINRVDPGFLSRIRAKELSASIAQKQQGAAAGAAAKPAASETLSGIAGFSAEPAAGVAAFSGAGADSAPTRQVSAGVATNARAFVDSAGRVDQAHLDFAHKLRASFSEPLMDAVHQPDSARIIVWLLILAKMDLKTGVAELSRMLQKPEVIIFKTHREEVFAVQERHRLPLLDLLLPALKQLETQQRQLFLKHTVQLIKCDKRYSMFEFVLLSLLKQHLSPGADREPKTKYFSYKSLKPSLQILFSVMVHSGAQASQRHKVFEKIKQGFMLKELPLLEKAQIKPALISQALAEITQLSPLLKRNVLEACTDIAMHDQALEASEAELLRVIAECLNCPIPPLLPSAV